MASLNEAIVAMKTANSALNTLVGIRCRPDVLDQNETLPAMTFQSVSRSREHSFGVALPPLSHPLVFMRGFAASSVLRTALMSAMRAAFSSKTQQTVGGITVFGCVVENELTAGVEMLDTATEAYVGLLYVRFHIKE